MKKNFFIIGFVGILLLNFSTPGLDASRGARPKSSAAATDLKSQLEAALNSIGANYTSANIGTSRNNWNSGSRTMFAIIKKFNNNQYKGNNGGNLIYIKIQGFFDAREAQAASDAKYLTNLNALLNHAKKTKFLDNNQKAIISGWKTQVQKQIAEQTVMNVINKTATVTVLQDKVVKLKSIAAKYGKIVVSEAVQTAFFNEIKSINNGLYELYLKTKTAGSTYTDEEKALAAVWVQAAPTFPLDKFKELLNFCTTMPKFKLLSSDQVNYVKELKTNFANFNAMITAVQTIGVTPAAVTTPAQEVAPLEVIGAVEGTLQAGEVAPVADTVQTADVTPTVETVQAVESATVVGTMQ